ncbi:MAG: hypothetical protein ACI8O8_000233 [Oleiphilaceae bacterium]|jgi:hypothetical protein
MSIKSITTKTWLFSALFAVLLSVQFFVQYSAQTQLKEDLTTLHEKQLTIVYKIYSLKNSTTQVQQ